MRALLCCGLALTGCGTLDTPEDFETGRTIQELRRPGSLPASIAAGGLEAPLAGQLAEACPDTKWIGYIIEGPAACPDPAPTDPAHGTWRVAPLVPPGGPANNALRRYCVYTWSANFAARRIAPAIDALPDQPSVRLERDCEVTGTASTGVDVPLEAARAITDAHHAQLHAPVPLTFAPSDVALSPVRVAVVDTAADNHGGPDGDTGPDRSTNGHAFAVGDLIQRISCFGGEACVANIHSELALGRVFTPFEGVIDWVIDEGGHFGSQGETADAMYRAVSKWLAAADREAHLIINLSIGWDAIYGNHKPGKMRVPARMPYDVARWATCQGALLIAAAGNRSDLELKQAAIIPAGWERKPAGCAAADAYDPLVHAVAGVDGRDKLLFNARTKAIPRLLAPADHVLSATNGFDAPTTYSRLDTGSSMAAAAVAGAAAAVWSVRPDLARHEVMDIVHQSGRPLGPNARFGLKGEKQPRHRVSVCHAVALACVGGCAIPADQVPACEPLRPKKRDASPEWGALIPLFFELWDDPNDPFDVHESVLVEDPIGPAPAQPAEVAPYAFPQPIIHGCSACGIWGTTVYGKLQPLGNPTFVSGWMRADLTGGCSDKWYWVPQAILDNKAFKVKVSVPPSCSLKRAGFSLYTNTGTLYVTSSALFVK